MTTIDMTKHDERFCLVCGLLVKDYYEREDTIMPVLCDTHKDVPMDKLEETKDNWITESHNRFRYD